MKHDYMKWAYATMAYPLNQEYRMPGVEDAFSQGSFCLTEYGKILDAYSSLCRRLGVEDQDDDDVETIINSFFLIQEELCYRMYHYGALFGMSENQK